MWNGCVFLYPVQTWKPHNSYTELINWNNKVMGTRCVSWSAQGVEDGNFHLKMCLSDPSAQVWVAWQVTSLSIRDLAREMINRLPAEVYDNSLRTALSVQVELQTQHQVLPKPHQGESFNLNYFPSFSRASSWRGSWGFLEGNSWWIPVIGNQCCPKVNYD